MGQGSCGARSGRRPPRNPSPIPSIVRSCTTKATAFFYGTRFKGVTLHPFDVNAHIHKAEPNCPMGPSLPLASVRRPFENRISNTFDEFCLPNFIFIFARQVDFKNFEILFISSKVFESPDKYGSPMACHHSVCPPPVSVRLPI